MSENYFDKIKIMLVSFKRALLTRANCWPENIKRIIMDNGGSHKSKEIKDIVKKSKNILQYSVPYKPKTNAI